MWPRRAKSELDQLADTNWEQVKEQAGLPRDGWTSDRLSRRDDPHISSITRRVSHKTAGQFTYKFQLRPQSRDGFEAHFQQQQAAFDRFPHTGAFTMPRPVFCDAERQVSLMAFIEGQPMSEAIKQCKTADDQLRMLGKCGAWLDAFHKSQYEQRVFRPGHTLRYYETLRQKVDTGEVAVPARQLFMRGIDKLVEVAPSVAGLDTVATLHHGDFHMRNLICNAEQIAGIDVSKNQLAPVGYDIAKILLDFTTVFRGGIDPADGQVVHPETRDAFFEGYKLVGADDPSARFLLYARILATLNTVPAKQKDRTEAKQRTLERLRPIARNAFRSEGPNTEKSPKKPIVFLLTKRGLEAAKDGRHEFANAVERAFENTDYKVTYRRNTQTNRDHFDPEHRSLVHMSHPVGPKGLVFRRAYAGPFWHLETRAARWNWSIAKRRFSGDDIDGTLADAFFKTWRASLLPQTPSPATQDVIYMPLQGKLLQRRGFQRAAPIDMIKTTLKHTDLPIQATLHPSETYTEAELAELSAIARAEERFSVVTLPMHDALASCAYVVTENSSAAFHAILYERPSVLFAGIDFHHICIPFDRSRPATSFASATRSKLPFRSYLYWYWALNCINLDDPNACKILRDRVG